MTYQLQGCDWLGSLDLAQKKFWKAVASGLSPTAAATVVGVAGWQGRKWARAAGYQTNRKHYGIRYSPACREAFWEAVQAGSSPRQAAVAAGVSEHTGLRWIQQAGYVPKTPFPAGSEFEAAQRRQSMSVLERCRLEELLGAGCTPA
jgi:transposase, IS30 family